MDFILLCIGGMGPFEALCLTFGTAGTGGFGVLNSSYAEYSMFCKWVTTVFMALFGMNFNFYYLVILRKVKDAVKMEEIRWYPVSYTHLLFNFMEMGYNKHNTIFAMEKEHTEKECHFSP